MKVISPALQLVLTIALWSAVGSADNGKLWTPMPAPAGCPAFEVQLVQLDASRSMRRAGLFDAAKQQVKQYVGSAPECTYFLLSAFGATADVVADRFVTTDEAREALQAAVDRLRPNQKSTNLDEAAKLLEWVRYKVTEAYGERVTAFFAKILSDQASWPDPGKPAFSIKQYLAERVANGNIQVLEVALAPPGTKVAQTSVPKDYSITVTVPVESLRHFLEQADSSHREKVNRASPEPTPPAAAKTTSTSTSPSVASLGMVLLGGALLVLVIGTAIWALGRGPQNPPKVDVGPRGDKSPEAILVTETELPRAEGQRERYLRQQRVPVAPDVPVTFGTDENSHYAAGPGLDAKAPVLFTITPARNGTLVVRPNVDASVGGASVRARGSVTVPVGEAATIRVGSREFLIQPGTGETAADALFRKIAGERLRAVAPQEGQS